MNIAPNQFNSRMWCLAVLVSLSGSRGWAHLTESHTVPNAAKASIAKSLQNEIGGGRGDANVWNTSLFQHAAAPRLPLHAPDPHFTRF